MCCAALGTIPIAVVLREVVVFVTAHRTEFCRRRPPVNFFNSTAVPIAFIGDEAGELSPSRIGDAFGLIASYPSKGDEWITGLLSNREGGDD